jgi:hypothetical protein
MLGVRRLSRNGAPALLAGRLRSCAMQFAVGHGRPATHGLNLIPSRGNFFSARHALSLWTPSRAQGKVSGACAAGPGFTVRSRLTQVLIPRPAARCSVGRVRRKRYETHIAGGLIHRDAMRSASRAFERQRWRCVRTCEASGHIVLAISPGYSIWMRERCK